MLEALRERGGVLDEPLDRPAEKRVDGGADHSDDGVLGEEANLSLSTDRRRDTLAEKDGDAAAEALLAARERGVLLEIPRWYGAAAKRVDAVFAPSKSVVFITAPLNLVYK